MSSNQITETFASALESEFYRQEHSDKDVMDEWFTTYGDVDKPSRDSKVADWGFIPAKVDIEAEFAHWLREHWDIGEEHVLHDPILGSIEWDDIKEQLEEYWEMWKKDFPESEGEGEGEGEEARLICYLF